MSGRWGVRFSENMYGSLVATDASRTCGRFVFHMDAATDDFARTMSDGRMEATGWVEAEGLARHAPLRGFMIIAPLVRRIVRYEFEFTGDDGRPYRYEGQKTIRHLHPFRTWTTLPGSVRDAEGREVARGVSRFLMRELGSFLLGFRASRSQVGVRTA